MIQNYQRRQKETLNYTPFLTNYNFCSPIIIQDTLIMSHIPILASGCGNHIQQLILQMLHSEHNDECTRYQKRNKCCFCESNERQFVCQGCQYQSIERYVSSRRSRDRNSGKKSDKKVKNYHIHCDKCISDYFIDFEYGFYEDKDEIEINKNREPSM